MIKLQEGNRKKIFNKCLFSIFKRCTNNTTWHNNPQFLITTNQPTNVFLSLTQPDLRLQWKFKYDCAIGMYLFKTSSPTRKVNYTLEEVLVNTSFQAVRDSKNFFHTFEFLT